jgi:hypothetical protein
MIWLIFIAIIRVWFTLILLSQIYFFLSVCCFPYIKGMVRDETRTANQSPVQRVSIYLRPSSQLAWRFFALNLRSTHTFWQKIEIEIQKTPYIGRNFTWNLYIKYPQTQRNLMWNFHFYVNSPFKAIFLQNPANVISDINFF